MIHMVQASEDQMRAGLRVEARFKQVDEANGRIDDIVLRARRRPCAERGGR